jgi:hypothetical protein
MKTHAGSIPEPLLPLLTRPRKVSCPGFGGKWGPASPARFIGAGTVVAMGLLVLLLGWPAAAQDFTRAMFRLLEGSVLIDDCPVCGRPTLSFPLEGTFELVRRDSNPLFSTYYVTNVAFRTRTAEPKSITGHGLYTIGGEVAVQQRMTLDLVYESKNLAFSNSVLITEKLFPLISIELDQVNPTLLQVLTLKLLAAPVREIWFSTLSGFTPAAGGHASGGDLVSASGDFVRTASNLVAKFELPPSAFPVNVDAFDVQPGGEIWFSLAETQPTSSVGTLYQGDLLSDRGLIVKRNQALTAAFGPMPVVPDVGLDAVMVADDGEIFFSITTPIFGERAGRLLRPGDVLSNRGLVVASNAQLLSRFQPTITTEDFGLDALYIWPSGEIWFSTEHGFQDKELGAIGQGDLLSNQGIIVQRNLDLLAAFAPVEDLADFGLDALFIVTDVRTTPAPPQLKQPTRSSTLTHLEWDGLGRAFQLLRSSRVDGDYQPVSPIRPDLNHDNPTSLDRGFYRVLQW